MLRRPWFFSLLVLVALAVLVVAAVGHLRFHAAASRLPERGQMTRRVAQCAGRVQVDLDARGIPHVAAAHREDAWLALGYLHARERFFQMEMARRSANGRLAEVFGEAALSLDRNMRTLRVAATAQRQAAQLSEAERMVLHAYADGVNLAREEFGRWLAPELWLLGYDPQPWQLEDSLAIGVLVQLNLSWAMGEEMQRAVSLARLGEVAATDAWGWSPEEVRAWMPRVEQPVTLPNPDEAFTPPLSQGGSNSWAVSARRSATGRPLLANDPHLAVGIPSTWYAAHLRAPGLHVAGVTIPGTPGVAIGHTEGVAWGLTMSMLDDQDLYLLTLDDSRTHELVDGVWRPLRTVSEAIGVRWRDNPEPLRVRVSERGPVVRESGREVLALSWSGHSGPSPLRAFLAMASAQSVAEVAGAWEGISGPAMHVVAADTRGHILHQVVGMIPDRGRGAGRLPAPGADSVWAWRGFLPLAANPHRADPEEGYLATANHDLFTEGDYPNAVRFPGEFMSPWRIRRIRSVLAGRPLWDVDGFLELQLDTLSGRAVAMLKLLQPDLMASGGDSARRLLEWDGRMDRQAVAAHLYSQLISDLGQAVGGDEAFQRGLKSSPVGPAELLRLLAGGMDERWWDDVNTDGLETRRELIARCLDRLDRMPEPAPWGAVHQVRFRHALEDFPLLGRLFMYAGSRGPFGVPGDGVTVNVHDWSRSEPYRVTLAPSMRMVCDVGSWDRTVLVVAPGQSGRLWSSHYDDQLRTWLEGGAPTLAFSEQAVADASRSRLILEPLNPPSSPPSPPEMWQ